MTPEEQFAALLQGPDVEQGKQRYEGMQAEIRGALSERLALPEWETDPATASEAPCGDFPDVHPFNTATFGLPLWSTKGDRKSTRLNSSHVKISYAVFCLKRTKPHSRLFATDP